MAHSSRISSETVHIVLQKRKDHPFLGCRKLSRLLAEQDGIVLSKSSINAIAQESGLSFPVGRRAKKPYRAQETPAQPMIPASRLEHSEPLFPRWLDPSLSTGMVLLKAMDCLIGGSVLVEQADSALKIAQLIPRLFQDSLCVRFTLTDTRTFCVDAQFHAPWSTLNIPFDFCTSFFHLQQRLTAFLEGSSPLCLFMAPGYETPTKELFSLLEGLDGSAARLQKCTVYGTSNDELAILTVHDSRRQSCIFGLWPWQFSGYRQIKNITEFTPFTDPLSERTFYRAEIAFELFQPELKRSVPVCGYALKDTPQDKVRLIVGAKNFSCAEPGQDAVACYLRHWPNLEDSFRDYSRKVEIATYSAGSRRLFSPDLEGAQAGPWKRDLFLPWYRRNLDKYLRWHFFPESCRNWDFQRASELLYARPAHISARQGMIAVSLSPEAVLKDDLSAACRRINEHSIRCEESGLPVFFSVSER